MLERTYWWRCIIDILREELSESSALRILLLDIQVVSDEGWCERQILHREYAWNSLEAKPILAGFHPDL